MAARSSSSEDSMGEATEETLGLKIMKNETTEAFIFRQRSEPAVRSSRVHCFSWMSTG